MRNLSDCAIDTGIASIYYCRTERLIKLANSKLSDINGMINLLAFRDDTFSFRSQVLLGIVVLGPLT